MMAPTLSKRERIVSRRLTEALFSGQGSHSMAAFPLRVVYMTRERQSCDAPVQLLFSVPKRHFRHAVDRNRVKRQLREAYRHRKQVVCDAVAPDRQLLIAVIWLSDRHSPSELVGKRVDGLLHRIAEQLKRERP